VCLSRIARVTESGRVIDRADKVRCHPFFKPAGRSSFCGQTRKWPSAVHKPPTESELTESRRGVNKGMPFGSASG